MLSSALIMVSPASGDAAGDMIKPSVEYRAIYDSNIYRLKDKDRLKILVGDDQLYDYIHNISARVDVEYPVSKQKLDFTYKKDFMFFSHYASEDFQEEEISGGVSLNVLDMITGRLYGGYQRKAQSREDYRSPERVFQDTDTVGGYLDYRYMLGWGIRGGYIRKENGYSPDTYKSSERVTQDYSGNIYYSPSPVYKLFVKFLNRDIDYVNETSLRVDNRRGDNTERAVSGGIDYKVAGRIILYLDAGYKWKRYNDNDLKYRDYDGPVWGVGIDYYITAKLLGSGQMDRDIREEIFQDQIYSEVDSWHVSFRYHITDKINTIVGGGRKRYSYKKGDISIPFIEERKDDMWSASVQLLYLPVKAISISLSYSYSSRDSNKDLYVFDTQQVGAGIAFRY